MIEREIFKTVGTTNDAGITECERLVEQGWQTYRVGLFQTTFYKQPPVKSQSDDDE